VTSTVYSIKLGNRIVEYQELNLKQYRNLLKCLLGDEIVPEHIILNTNKLLLEITDLQNLNELSYIEYILLLIQIRLISIGDVVFLNLIEDEKQYKAELSLSRVVENVSNNLPSQLFELHNFNDWKIKIKLPSVYELLQINKKDTFIDSFIDTIITEKLSIDFKHISLNDKNKVLEHIPVKIVTNLNKTIQEVLKQVELINILEPITKQFTTEKRLPLIPNIDILAFIIKLIYNTNLEGLYESIFVLSKAANISAEYLDTCSPGEFYLYIKKLEEYNAARAKSNAQQNNNLTNTPDLSEVTEDQFPVDLHEDL